MVRKTWFGAVTSVRARTWCAMKNLDESSSKVKLLHAELFETIQRSSAELSLENRRLLPHGTRNAATAFRLRMPTIRLPSASRLIELAWLQSSASGLATALDRRVSGLCVARLVHVRIKEVGELEQRRDFVGGAVPLDDGVRLDEAVRVIVGLDRGGQIDRLGAEGEDRLVLRPAVDERLVVQHLVAERARAGDRVALAHQVPFLHVVQRIDLHESRGRALDGEDKVTVREPLPVATVHVIGQVVVPHDEAGGVEGDEAAELVPVALGARGRDPAIRHEHLPRRHARHVHERSVVEFLDPCGPRTRWHQPSRPRQRWRARARVDAPVIGVVYFSTTSFWISLSSLRSFAAHTWTAYSVFGRSCAM